MVTFNDADDFMSTMAEGGKAFRFEDIDGIGPATADKITAVRGVNAPTDVKGMSADELADKAGISENRARKAISGAGGNPNVSKTQSSSGSVSAAGVRTRVGDFWVDFADQDKARARNDPQSRSQEAVRTDEHKRAPITTSLDTWKNAPSAWDFPGVDTPTQDPGVLPKDYKAGGTFETADFDDQGRAEYDDEGETYPQVKNQGTVLDTGTDRISAWDVAREVPEGSIPGLGEADFEEGEQLPAFDSESKTMGPTPSSQRLPESVRQNLAGGEVADMAFVQAEQSRGGSQRETFTATVSPNTLYGGWTVDADLAGGLGLPSSIRKEIQQRVRSQVGADPEETPGWKDVAEVTLSKPADEPKFNTTWKIESIKMLD